MQRVLAGFLCASILSAQERVDLQVIQRIKQEAFEHSKVMDHLFWLTDVYGPRLTGSPLLKQANQWTAEMFRKYGLTNVHLEPYRIAHAWMRGTANARILSRTEHPLTIASAAWSPNTKGPVRGPVVYFDAKKPE